MLPTCLFARTLSPGMPLLPANITGRLAGCRSVVRGRAIASGKLPCGLTPIPLLTHQHQSTAPHRSFQRVRGAGWGYTCCRVWTVPTSEALLPVALVPSPQSGRFEGRAPIKAPADMLQGQPCCPLFDFSVGGLRIPVCQKYS